jgi:hypothetical protein
MRSLPSVEAVLAELTVVRWRPDFAQGYPVAADLPWIKYKSYYVFNKLEIAL